jgi:hypothetical protein
MQVEVLLKVAWRVGGIRRCESNSLPVEYLPVKYLPTGTLPRFTTFSDMSKSGAMGSCPLWVVRHGERIDETALAADWARSTPKSRRFDPPLTKEGGRQAVEAGKTLFKFGINFDKVEPCSFFTHPPLPHFFDFLFFSCKHNKTQMHPDIHTTRTYARMHTPTFTTINGLPIFLPLMYDLACRFSRCTSLRRCAPFQQPII